MNKKHIIILGGYPGSGKSTIKRLLAERLNYRTFSTGDFVRDLASSRGMTLEEFNEVIAQTKDIDLLIDDELERIEAEEDFYVVDSHLAFHFIPSGFSVYLDISLDESARRIFNDREAEMRIKSGDIMNTYEEAKHRTQKRIENHKERYHRHYGVDPYLPSQYSLVINSEAHTPEEIAEQIFYAYTEWIPE